MARILCIMGIASFLLVTGALTVSVVVNSLEDFSNSSRKIFSKEFLAYLIDGFKMTLSSKAFFLMVFIVFAALSLLGYTRYIELQKAAAGECICRCKVCKQMAADVKQIKEKLNVCSTANAEKAIKDNE